MRAMTMTMARRMTTGLALIALAAGTGCADTAVEASGGAQQPPGATGITQSGAQDFGLFRQILEDGEIPTPDTIDDLGFFAEHKLDYPEPTCGQDLCMHGLVGVWGNMMTGANCTLMQIGLNSPIDVSEMERPPLNLVLAIDVSGSMGGQPINYVRSGLQAMLDHLEATDKVSIVLYSDDAEILREGTAATEVQDLHIAIGSIEASGSTNIYAGLFTAYDVAERQAEEGYQNRVVILSDGRATAGIQSPGKMAGLAEGWAREGIGLTAIGVGSDFDVDLMRDLAEKGSGNFYFLEDPSAVQEVFTDEVKTFMVPVALDVEIKVTVGGGYWLRAVYGTHGWSGGTTGGVIQIPALFLAGRTDSSAPIEDGRRGGGGAIIAELVPRFQLNDIQEPYNVGQLVMEYTHPVTRERLQQVVDLDSPYMPGEIPDGGWFTDKTVEKGFVMLQLLAAFQMAAEMATDADPGGARGLLQAIKPEVEAWLQGTPDPDIEDDLTYVDRFLENLDQMEVQTKTTPPPEPWPMGGD